MKKKIPRGEENYYVNDEGLLVFTEAFLKKRGSCCHNRCKHCPYKDCFCQKDGGKTEKK